MLPFLPLPPLPGFCTHSHFPRSMVNHDHTARAYLIRLVRTKTKLPSFPSLWMRGNRSYRADLHLETNLIRQTKWSKCIERSIGTAESSHFLGPNCFQVLKFSHCSHIPNQILIRQEHFKKLSLVPTDFYYQKSWEKNILVTMHTSSEYWILIKQLILMWAYNKLDVPGDLAVENLPAIQEMQETWAQSLSWEESPGGGHGNPLQHSCLKNPMDREAWQS